MSTQQSNFGNETTSFNMWIHYNKLKNTLGNTFGEMWTHHSKFKNTKSSQDWIGNTFGTTFGTTNSKILRVYKDQVNKHQM